MDDLDLQQLEIDLENIEDSNDLIFDIFETDLNLEELS